MSPKGTRFRRVSRPICLRLPRHLAATAVSSPGTVSVAQGSGKTFTIAANNGYEIADVVVDNQSKGAVTSYTFNDIAANHTITATFNAVSAAVRTDDDPSGSTSTGDSSSSPDSSGTTDYNEQFRLCHPATVIIDNGGFRNERNRRPGECLLVPVLTVLIHFIVKRFLELTHSR